MHNEVLEQNVIVFGDSHPTTLKLIRSLGRAGYDIFLISVGDKKKDVLHFSKYIKRYYIVSTPQEGVEILNDIKLCLQSKPIIFTSGDDVALSVDKNVKSLSLRYYVPYFENNNSMEYMMRKDVMNEMAKDAGLNVPNSWKISCNKQIPDDLEFPILVKPYKSVDGSKSDIKICYNRVELDKYIETTHLHEFLASQFIEKDYEVCIVGSRLANSKRTLVPGIVRKIRQLPLPFGPRTYGKLQFNETLPCVEIDKIKKLIGLTKFCGLYSVEMLVKNGISWFVEINFRADGNIMDYTVGGCNIPKSIVEDYQHGFSKEDVISKEIYATNERDRMQVTEHNITYFNWLHDFLKASNYCYLDKYDWKPFIIHRFRVHRDLITYRFRKAIRILICTISKDYAK